MLVGEPIRIPLQEGLDEPQVDFVMPPDNTVVHREAVRDADGETVAELTETDVAGLYTSRWRQQDGVEQTRLLAINVDPAEGELATVAREQLERLLVGVPFTMERAESMQEDRESLAGTSLTTPLLYLLVILLILEQLVSYSASYHPVARRR